jgi:hypothetical protein
MRICSRHVVSFGIVTAAALAAAGCCSSVSGPTGPAVRYTATLAPGELRYYDVDTPSGTTQINLQFLIDSLTVPIRVRQIDPSCTPSREDTCQTFYDAQMPPRPAGVAGFGNSIPPRGSRSRIVLQNMSAEDTVTYTVTITPHQAGCT